MQILLYTMGSPSAFEYRRQELRSAGLGHSDADVARSFASIVDTTPCTTAAGSAPGEDTGRVEGEGEGLLLRYLSLAQVAVVLGDTLFLHGAVHDFNKG